MIVVVGNAGVAALHQETRTIPIVFVLVGDPVGSGFVSSLARPGGNITGFMHFEPAMGAKWLEILKAIAPAMTRALVLHLPEVKANVEFVRSAQNAGPTFNVAVSPARVHNTDDIEHAVTAFAGELNGGLIILPNPIAGTHRALVAETGHSVQSCWHVGAGSVGSGCAKMRTLPATGLPAIRPDQCRVLTFRRIL